MDVDVDDERDTNEDKLADEREEIGDEEDKPRPWTRLRSRERRQRIGCL